MSDKSRRRFGKVKKLPSARHQASYVGPDGMRHNAPQTFARKTDAERWLSLVEADIERGRWINDDAGRDLFGEYARTYLDNSSRIGPRWKETCLRNLRLHLAEFEKVQLRSVTPLRVREWHATAMRGTGGRTSIAQSYRFLRAVMYAAVRDGAIAANPCTIPGAGADRAKERPVATPTQVDLLMQAINPPRYRAAIAIAAWCGLRRGEVIALYREDLKITFTVNESTGEVTPVEAQIHVRRNRVELLTGHAFDGPPKTDAGRREVSVPPHVIPFLVEHLDTWAGDTRLFVGRTGEPMRGDAIRQAWTRARDKVRRKDPSVPAALRYHDLRHTGQTLAAATGATVKDLMRRLGHASPVAANRYLHAVEGRDAEIASALSALAKHGNAAKLPGSITVK